MDDDQGYSQTYFLEGHHRSGRDNDNNQFPPIDEDDEEVYSDEDQVSYNFNTPSYRGKNGRGNEQGQFVVAGHDGYNVESKKVAPRRLKKSRGVESHGRKPKIVTSALLLVECDEAMNQSLENLRRTTSLYQPSTSSYVGKNYNKVSSSLPPIQTTNNFQHQIS